MSFFGLFGPPNVEKLKAKRDIQGLIKALSYKKDSGEIENVSVRAAAAQALGEIGDVRAVEPLLAALQDKYSLVLQTVAKALGQIGDIRAIDPLLALTKKGFAHDDSRKAVKEALVKLGSAEIETLIAPLQNLNHNGQIKVLAEVIGELRDARAIEPLVTKIAKLASATWRDEIAIEALEDVLLKLGEIAVEPLARLVTSSNHQEHIVAYRALKRLQWLPPSDIQHIPVLLALGEPERVATLGIEAIEPLVLLLDNPNSSIRRNAARSLGQIGDARATKPLMRLLDDSGINTDNITVCCDAADALGQIGDSQAVHTLIRLLKRAALGDTTYPQVVEAAVKALVKIGDMQAIRPMVDLLTDDGLKDNYLQHLANGLHQLGWQPADDKERAILAIGFRHWDQVIELGAIAAHYLIRGFSRMNYATQEESIEALQKLISQDAANIASEDLHLIAKFKNTTRVINERVYDSCGNETGQTEKRKVPGLDFSHLRQLARQELKRRGEQA